MNNTLNIMNSFNVDTIVNEKSYTCPVKFQDTYKTKFPIYVLGDLHGDFDILIECLQKIKLIDNNYNWIGKRCHLVQLGDIFDRKRGNENDNESIDELDEFKILIFLNNLDIDAKRQGGKVHIIIGNHELMNMMGDFSYVHSQHLKFINKEIRYKLFRPGGYISTIIACHCYGVLKINNWVFCHAGLIQKKITNKSITEINKLIRDILSNKRPIQELNENEHKLIFGNDSIFWTRYYSNESIPIIERCNTLQSTLENLNITFNKKGGMIVGHTPHNKITHICNKHFYFADIGLSSAFSKYGNISKQMLEILPDSDPAIITL